MANVLGRESCERFYRLRDALADYAYERLGIEDKLYVGRGVKYSNKNKYLEETLNDTLNELWETPTVLSDFISENPAGFNPEDLATIRSWKTPVKGWFMLFKHRGKLLFLNNKVLFEVTGLWDEIETVLKKSDFPMMMETTLLPFEGRVVYHGFMSHMPINLGQGFRNMMDSEIQEALREAKIIASEYDFIRIAPEIKKRQQEEHAEMLRRETMLSEEGTKQMQGYHKGVLAGLAEEEREEAINKTVSEGLAEEIHEYIVNELKHQITNGAVTRDLQKLLATEQKNTLRHWAIVLEPEVSAKGRKQDLIQGLLLELKRNTLLIELVMTVHRNLMQFDAYRSLYEAGGTLEIEEKTITRLADLPAANHPICYTFYTKGTAECNGKFTFIIPEDIMDVLGTVNWEELRAKIASCEAASDIADAAVELRGIVKIEEAFEEYLRFYPSALTMQEFEMIVAKAIREERIGCVWLEADDGNDYLIHYGLSDYYREAEAEGYDNEGDDEELQDVYLSGSLKPFEHLLAYRERKKIRHLEDGMLSSESLYNWKCALPATRAMRDYLDNHVPDSQDDYYYADKVIEELIEYMTFGMMDGGKTFTDWLEILESNGYIPNEGHLNRVMGLLTNMHNSMPDWMNNGWSPNELADIQLGRKSFYNEDGSRMKVGRNDPCPCGSGKKYKHCCGRR